jgi:hypothetical protein
VCTFKTKLCQTKREEWSNNDSGNNISSWTPLSNIKITTKYNTFYVVQRSTERRLRPQEKRRKYQFWHQTSTISKNKACMRVLYCKHFLAWICKTCKGLWGQNGHPYLCPEVREKNLNYYTCPSRHSSVICHRPFSSPRSNRHWHPPPTYPVSICSSHSRETPLVGEAGHRTIFTAEINNAFGITSTSTNSTSWRGAYVRN